MASDETKAAFFFGLGAMGVIAGFGLGSTAPNKLALLIGAGSLFYANKLNPVVDIDARPELSERFEAIKDRASSSLPFQGQQRAVEASPGGFTFRF